MQDRIQKVQDFILSEDKNKLVNNFELVYSNMILEIVTPYRGDTIAELRVNGICSIIFYSNLSVDFERKGSFFNTLELFAFLEKLESSLSKIFFEKENNFISQLDEDLFNLTKSKFKLKFCYPYKICIENNTLSFRAGYNDGVEFFEISVIKNSDYVLIEYGNFYSTSLANFVIANQYKDDIKAILFSYVSKYRGLYNEFK